MKLNIHYCTNWTSKGQKICRSGWNIFDTSTKHGSDIDGTSNVSIDEIWKQYVNICVHDLEKNYPNWYSIYGIGNPFRSIRTTDHIHWCRVPGASSKWHYYICFIFYWKENYSKKKIMKKEWNRILDWFDTSRS